MGIFQGDIRIRTALELGFEDVMKNDWLLDDILKDTISNPYLRDRYGSQISSAKQWLANNRVYFFMSERDDKLEFPCVVIEMGSSNEKESMKSMADLSYQSIKLMPNNINKPIPFVTKPIGGGTYSSATGAFSFNADVDLNAVSPGMILVNPATGTGFVIKSVTVANQVNLLPNLVFTPALYGIIPEYQFYEAKIGHTFMQENYRIICNSMDQQSILWLHSIVVYSLLRYRQTLLEHDGFAESTISSSKMFPNPDYSDAGQIIWSKEANITGQVEQTFIIQPHRIIENISLGNANGYEGGVKILSNTTDSQEDLSTVNWSTLQDLAYRDE